MGEKKIVIKAKKEENLALFEKRKEITGDEIKVQQIETDLIIHNPNQPRKNFGREKLEELVKSIESNGILQPVVVRKKGSSFELVIGERRFRAALQLGYTRIPAIVREEVDDKKGMLMALVENIQRDDLNPVEMADAYNMMINEYGMTQEELAKKVGKSRVAITNTMRLIKLSDGIKSYINQGKITEGHARALLSLKTPELQNELCEKIISEELSVREAENIAHKVGVAVSRETCKIAEKDEHIVEIESSLEKVLGMKVNIYMKKRNSKIEVLCNSQSDLEKIINKLISN